MTASLSPAAETEAWVTYTGYGTLKTKDVHLVDAGTSASNLTEVQELGSFTRAG